MWGKLFQIYKQWNIVPDFIFALNEKLTVCGRVFSWNNVTAYFIIIWCVLSILSWLQCCSCCVLSHLYVKYELDSVWLLSHQCIQDIIILCIPPAYLCVVSDMTCPIQLASTYGHWAIYSPAPVFWYTATQRWLRVNISFFGFGSFLIVALI